MLARAFRRGDASAFDALLVRHERSLYLFCLRFLGDRAAAEDACQEVFLRAVKGLAKWDGRATVKTWLFTIARNHCVDLQRRGRHRKTESLDRASHEGDVPLVERLPGPDGERPDRAHARKTLGAAIAEGLAHLPEEQREVFTLREQAGMAFGEIAAVTGVPENTVKSRMRYALEHLRRHLDRTGWGRGEDR